MISTQRPAMPVDMAAMVTRSISRLRIMCRRLSPSSPRRVAAGPRAPANHHPRGPRGPPARLAVPPQPRGKTGDPFHNKKRTDAVAGAGVDKKNVAERGVVKSTFSKKHLAPFQVVGV